LPDFARLDLRAETPEWKMAMTDFNALDQYRAVIAADPFRRGLHYPAVEKELGCVRNRRILDVGCGDSPFPAMLAEHGASVVGYDKAGEKIKDARNHEETSRLGLRYVEATPQIFSDPGVFNAATSILVLPYAETTEELTVFFRSTSRHLKAGGQFLSIVLNPHFSAFGERIGARRITKLSGKIDRVEFLDPATGDVVMTVTPHRYRKDEYERCALAGGMTPVAWKNLYATPEAVEAMSPAFWRACHDKQPYALFVTRKD
jgi:2-polyprenyl-3-methyl-5-hydroxy-6-metoxy-1,4-benzoquinol methylase